LDLVVAAVADDHVVTLGPEGEVEVVGDDRDRRPLAEAGWRAGVPGSVMAVATVTVAVAAPLAVVLGIAASTLSRSASPGPSAPEPGPDAAEGPGSAASEAASVTSASTRNSTIKTCRIMSSEKGGAAGDLESPALDRLV